MSSFNARLTAVFNEDKCSRKIQDRFKELIRNGMNAEEALDRLGDELKRAIRNDECDPDDLKELTRNVVSKKSNRDFGGFDRRDSKNKSRRLARGLVQPLLRALSNP
jgi:hypothetical protein